MLARVRVGGERGGNYYGLYVWRRRVHRTHNTCAHSTRWNRARRGRSINAHTQKYTDRSCFLRSWARRECAHHGVKTVCYIIFPSIWILMMVCAHMFKYAFKSNSFVGALIGKKCLYGYIVLYEVKKYNKRLMFTIFIYVASSSLYCLLWI